MTDTKKTTTHKSTGDAGKKPAANGKDANANKHEKGEAKKDVPGSPTKEVNEEG